MNTAPMAKRRQKRRPKPPVETATYSDSEGNVLELRCSLSAKTIAKIGEGPGRDATTLEDSWQRREEMLFERLAASWEIAGLPLTEQAMLLGRYRLADSETKRWVRETIATHIERYLPELSGS